MNGLHTKKKRWKKIRLTVKFGLIFPCLDQMLSTYTIFITKTTLARSIGFLAVSMTLGVYRLKDGSIHIFNVTSKHGKILDFPSPMWFKPTAA